MTGALTRLTKAGDALQVLEGCAATYTADLWALGCILYQMLHGKPPFRAASEYLTFQKISAGTFEVSEESTEAARDMIERLLTIEPSERIGAAFAALDVDT